MPRLDLMVRTSYQAQHGFNPHVLYSLFLYDAIVALDLLQYLLTWIYYCIHNYTKRQKLITTNFVAKFFRVWLCDVYTL